MSLTQVFETTKKWKELKFNADQGEIFSVGDDFIVPDSVFISTQTTTYPASTHRSYEVKLKGRKVEESNSWTMLGSRVEYQWTTDARSPLHSMESLPEWLNDIVYADNSGN